VFLVATFTFVAIGGGLGVVNNKTSNFIDMGRSSSLWLGFVDN